MNIYTAAHYMKAGYRIRRQKWIGRHNCAWIDMHHVVGAMFRPEDFLAEDWEVVLDDIVDNYGLTVLYKLPVPDEEEE